MSEKHAEFSKNLRGLCAEAGSMAQACRDIGINRQQFNRYVTGASLPSAHNLHRIAMYFGISESDLFRDSAEFLGNRRARTEGAVPDALKVYSDAFRQQDVMLRRHLGYYHGHFLTPSWEGYIYRSLIRLQEQNGFVVSRTIERAQAPDRSMRQRVVFEGLAALRGNRIYMIEVERNMEGSIAQTILFPSHRHEVKYLRGQTAGLAWRPRRQPYASRAIWKRIPQKISAREAISQCGLYRIDSRDIDPTVRTFLTAEEDDHMADLY